jgi:hypothetical protein
MSSKSNISIEKQLHYAEKGEAGGVDIREPSTALLGISSIDRYRAGLNVPQVNPITTQGSSTLSSPYDFALTTLGQNLLTGFFTRLAVNEVQFRWTLPTITARNNRMYIYVAPNNNFAVTQVQCTGATTVFTLASTTGWTTSQTLVAGGFTTVSNGATPPVDIPINGVYTIASVTGTTLVCNNPNSLPVFTITAYTGNVYARGLITIPDGWYDVNNQDITTSSRGGNLAYQFQEAVKGITSIASLVNAFVVTYNLNYQGIANPGTSVTVVGQPYNTFFASNLASTIANQFFFGRYSEPTRPNAVGLFEQMAWNTSQQQRTFQYSSPNVSLLSTPFVDIVCNQLTQNQSLKDADSGDISRTMLCRVFLTPDGFTGNVANLGSNPILVHRAFPFPKQIRWNANQPIGNLSFQVYDSQGYILTTLEGLTGTMENPPNFYDSDMGDWTMTLLVSEV